ncbi:hypothetical protein P3T73_10265 [Kiritimatiellota bacterium B12222]|nr:hypothetical protein P3T73_10265 [Kiritimatiellota bacterium B12222]
MKNTYLFLILISALLLGRLVAEEYTLPYELTLIPEARLAISDVYDSPGGDREESIARFGSKSSREEVIAFYRKALEEAGFTIYSSSDKPTYAMIAGKRNDDRITIYFKTESDWVEADESEISFKAVYNKP